MNELTIIDNIDVKVPTKKSKSTDLIDLSSYKDQYVSLRLAGLQDYVIKENFGLSDKDFNNVKVQCSQELANIFTTDKDKILEQQIISIENMIDDLNNVYMSGIGKNGKPVTEDYRLKIFHEIMKAKEYIGKITGILVERSESKNAMLSAADVMAAMGIGGKESKKTITIGK